VIPLDWAILISAAAAISGIVLGWLGRSRTVRQDGAEDGELRASVNYIRQAVDDMRLAVAELAEVQAADTISLQLAIAELAEALMGGEA